MHTVDAQTFYAETIAAPPIAADAKPGGEIKAQVRTHTANKAATFKETAAMHTTIQDFGVLAKKHLTKDFFRKHEEALRALFQHLDEYETLCEFFRRRVGEDLYREIYPYMLLVYNKVFTLKGGTIDDDVDRAAHLVMPRSRYKQVQRHLMRIGGEYSVYLQTVDDRRNWQREDRLKRLATIRKQFERQAVFGRWPSFARRKWPEVDFYFKLREEEDDDDDLGLE